VWLWLLSVGALLWPSPLTADAIDAVSLAACNGESLPFVEDGKELEVKIPSRSGFPPFGVPKRARESYQPKFLFAVERFVKEMANNVERLPVLLSVPPLRRCRRLDAHGYQVGQV
jgi:hypothetical protein